MNQSRRCLDVLYIGYALSLGVSSVKILITAQASFTLVRAPMLGKEVGIGVGWGGVLFPHTQVTAQTTEVYEERWEHPCGKYMTMFNPRPYLSSKLFRHLLLKSLMIPG